MAKGMKDFVAAAREKVDDIEPGAARDAVESGSAVLLDVREAEELAQDGAIGIAHQHVPRGFLEPRADPESGMALDELTAARGDREILVLCASGARAALAAERLTEMGYGAKIIAGGLEGWRKAGLPIESRS